MQEPTNTDAVLGGKSPQVTSAVLGGIEGARRRLELAQTFSDRVEASRLLNQYSPDTLAIDPETYYQKLLSKIINSTTRLKITLFGTLNFLKQGVTGLFVVNDQRFRFTLTSTEIQYRLIYAEKPAKVISIRCGSACISSYSECRLSTTRFPKAQELIKELDEVQNYIHRNQMMQFYLNTKDPNTVPSVGDMIGSLEVISGINI
jgi:hypothetical protein